MLQKTEGIVIRTTDYGETNKILTLLTRENGKISVMANGAKKPKSRFASSAQLFIYGSFVYQRFKGMGTLNQSDILDSFRQIRSDIILTSYGACMVELIDRLVPEEQLSPALFDLLYHLLHQLDEGSDPDVLLNILEIKMLAWAGVAPTLDRCTQCQTTEGPFSFSHRFAGAVCYQCASADPHHQKVQANVVKLLYLFQKIPAARIGHINVKASTKKELKQIIDQYYEEYVGVYLKAKRFLAQVDRLSFEDERDIDS
ncbi:DNA repair protein RecO [Salisediminibacterium halotolerans]|uniref:DNA repair protein RecO n=1 Tax=Salisediminibacterium halotolerans TaxID=517425 RepID=A0A1H9S6P4_9BACI|nr:DNA repair protein RecO [Salisediminibacterium haloalkalitolerans]SER80716.1 DNA replication and repair protein RecO [Salisediminibacterium haloalkalitolerans]